MKCSKMKTNYQEALPILSSARLNLRGLVAKAKVRLIDFIKRFSGTERERLIQELQLMFSRAIGFVNSTFLNLLHPRYFKNMNPRISNQMANDWLVG